ncbi:hypothetical protein ASPWEDRAFT_233835 [Aspergillus wentii DTO 134E9]|uniref:Methyltransferase type 11 domain-containing protein n=1 Tax=Aspergillus wentii DTO 134E9 TaxID=1073089 RepID=A0A1L9S0X6_ASPWE|nr:uncharacterized protein ASPWEDRAFT_233835 [Aspergillus wentii DTO 134E9]KAI9931199.1 hypothetical protein MW887_010860 [Aspergillus wentii]OJJ40793.1 hypothetical protein ASPWEDRAFT_233835 [Aspergillus wentii DTO 134E9]
MTAINPPAFTPEENLFAKGEAFWNNYLKGRPSAPDVFFERIFNYHQEHNGQFGVIHDVGAGNGPYANTLRSKFQHVIISDIAAENVSLAQDRLGTDGFSYRAARVEEGDDIPDGSVDMVFATNVMHFCDQELAMQVIAKQLKPGGTFACAGFGGAYFEDDRVRDIYTRIYHCGGRALLKNADDPAKMIGAMARTHGAYNVAPLDEALFLPGAQRVHLNMQHQGIAAPLPPEVEVTEPLHTGVEDVQVFEMEDGWDFETDLNGLREHIESFPFANQDPVAFAELWLEMEEVVKDQTVKGQWPAKVILATRR